MDGDNKWYNEKTKKYMTVKKKIKIKKCPKILILCFNRFDNDNNKIDIKIDISQTLRLNKNNYDLYGICNHIGSSSGGHYTAFCKNNNSWYKFNDNIVTKISYESLVSGNNYCLFYRKI